MMTSCMFSDLVGDDAGTTYKLTAGNLKTDLNDEYL